MSFDISYIFTAKDKYSAVARKISQSNEKLKRSADSAAKAYKNKVVPAMRSVRNVGLGMTAAITAPILLAARSAVKLASDAEETRSKFATVFRDLGQGAENTADSFAKNFGLAGTTARKLVGDTGDLLTGFGFTQEKALELSNQVNELAVDLASFTNFSGGAEGASAALTKALLGERESLKSLGVAISEDLVKKKVATLVAEGSKFASLAEAKAVATLAIAVDQSKNAIGDYARTKASAANTSRLLSEKTIELREKFGKFLLPVQIKVTKALISMIDAMNSLSPSTKKIILVVAGVLAVAGPLLIALGSIALILPVIAAGFALISLPVLAVVAAVGAAVAAFVWLKTNWIDVSNAIGGTIEQIGINFSLLWKDITDGFKSFISFFMPAIENLLFPIQQVMKFGSFIGDTAGSLFGGGPATASPAVATANARATVNGEIKVSASEGSQVDSVESSNAFNGAQGNIGLGAAA